MHENVFDRVLDALRAAKDSTGSPLKVESIIYTDTTGTRQHHFTAPRPVNLRSIAKPIVCLALGKAIDEGMTWDETRISLSSKIWPYLSQIVNTRSEECERAWKIVTIRDLMRSTLGHDKGLLFSKDIKDRDPDSLLDYVVNYPISGSVGKDFVYSNAGAFVLSNLISKFSRIDLDRFVGDRLLSPIGICDVSWDKFGQTVAGCTGLWMSNVDLHKVGVLLLNDGRIDGEQLVPASHIAEMRQAQVTAPTHRYIAERAFPKWSYGLCLWICEDGTYYCDGTDGQYLIVLPRQEAVITVVASQPDTVPISEALGLFK